MRQKIINTIMKAGLNVDDFIIGNGARSSKSMINYNPSKEKCFGEGHKKYSIQFYQDVVAVYDIGRRIELNASIQLDWGNVTWGEIDEARERLFAIKGTDEYTKSAVMPFDCFEDYLIGAYRCNIEDGVTILTKEGDRIEIFSTRYERDTRLRDEAIRIHGTECMVCGFSFVKKYGDLGEGYIEVHHIIPISNGPRECNPETDLVCVCANCHRMIHRNKKKVISIQEMRRIVRRDV